MRSLKYVMLRLLTPSEAQLRALLVQVSGTRHSRTVLRIDRLALGFTARPLVAEQMHAEQLDDIK